MVLRFLYQFSFSEMLPMLEMQRLAFEQMALSAFQNRMLMEESLIRRQRKAKQASVLAEAEEKDAAKEVRTKGEAETTRTYTITYYNPETQKTEVIKEKTDIKVKDYAQAMIEESIGAASTYPVYRYVGAPIMREEIVPWKLKQILAEREYGTPPPFGGGAAVSSVVAVERGHKEAEIVKKREEEIKAALKEAIIRKEKSEIQIVEEIILLEETVEALRKGEKIDKALDKLPPLSRARYIAALRRKRLSRKAIIDMLLRDISFLKRLKKKLETFTLEDLLDMVKMLRDLRK